MCKQAITISDLPSYDIFVPQKLPLRKNFDEVISCDLWFRPPPIKNSGYVNELEIAWKKILKTFFFFGERLRLCPWPRAFLSLASRGSVLGKAVLGLGLGFFWCPWPWPRALCPRLHLC